MIVCICNAIGEDDIRACVRSGAPCPLAAYRTLGREPQCCSCLDFAAEIVADERAKLVGDRSRAA